MNGIKTTSPKGGIHTNLQEANNKMYEIFREYEIKAKEFQKIEFEYEKRYSELYLHSGMATLPMKEAEVKSILNEEGLGERVSELKADVRRLYYKWTILSEYCKNIRALVMRDNFQT